jgi:hypothetical protein
MRKIGVSFRTRTRKTRDTDPLDIIRKRPFPGEEPTNDGKQVIAFYASRPGGVIFTQRGDDRLLPFGGARIKKKGCLSLLAKGWLEVGPRHRHSDEEIYVHWDERSLLFRDYRTGYPNKETYWCDAYNPGATPVPNGSKDVRLEKKHDVF